MIGSIHYIMFRANTYNPCLHLLAGSAKQTMTVLLASMESMQHAPHQAVVYSAPRAVSAHQQPGSLLYVQLLLGSVWSVSLMSNAGSDSHQPR